MASRQRLRRRPRGVKNSYRYYQLTDVGHPVEDGPGKRRFSPIVRVCPSSKRNPETIRPRRGETRMAA